MSGETIVLGIKLTLDGKEVSGEIRGQTADLQKLGQTAQTANQQARSSGDQYAASLRKQAETLGMTRTQTMAYEASQQQLTTAQKQQVAGNIKAIEAHEKHEQLLGRVKLAAVGAGTALGVALVAGLKASVAAATEAEQTELRLQAVVRATGGVAGLTAQELIGMAGAFQDRLGINDEAVKGSMAVLLTFRSVARESFDEALEVAANLSKVMGTDLQSATLQLGKALEEPETGLLALRRSGVSFNETQKDMIKDMVETGNQAQAITTILKIMKEQGLDKVAESMNQGLYKATNTVKNEWDDFLEALGRTPTVKVPVEGTFGLISQRLHELKDLIELPVWERLKVIGSFGLYKPKADSSGAVPEVNNMDAVADAGARKLGNARDAYGSFAKQFRGDTEKMAIDMRKLDALYLAGGATAEQYAKSQEDIRKKYTKDPQKSEYDQVIKAIREKSAVQQAELEGQTKLTEAEQLAMKTMVGLRDGTLKLTEAQKIGLGVELEKMLALDRQAQLHVEQARVSTAAVESAELQIRASEREGEVLAHLNESLGERRQEIELETQLMGASDAQREKTIELRKLDNQFLKQSTELYGEAWEAAHKLYLLERSHISDALDRRGASKETQKQIEETKTAAKKMDEDLQRGLTDSIFRGFEAGKGFAENFRDSLVNLFKTTTLRPVIQWVVSPLTGAVTATLGSLGIPGLANAGGSGGGIGDMLGMASNANSLMGGGIGSTYGAIASSGLGTSLGLSTATAAGYAAPVFEAGALVSAGTGTAAGGLTAAGSTLGAAIPVVGWALAAYAAYKMLSDDGGGPASFTGIDVNANLSKGGFAGQLFGTSKNSEESFKWPTFMPGNLQETANAAVTAAFAQVSKLGTILGVDPSVLAGASANVSFRSASHDAAVITQDLVNNLGALTDQMALKLMPNIKDFAQANETLTQTLVRLAQAKQQADVTDIFSQMNAAIKLGDQMRDAALKLADQTKDLWLSDLSPLTHAQRLAQASGLYGQQLAAAQGGDLAALGNLSGTSRSYLQEARGYYASSQSYTDIFNQVQGQIGGLVDQVQIDATSMINTALTEQSIRFSEMGISLADINVNTKDLDKRIADALAKAIDAALAAQAAVTAASTQQIVTAVTESAKETALVLESADSARPSRTRRPRDDRD